MDQAVARPAGFWIRVVAFVIDAIVIMLAQALLRVIAARRWGADLDGTPTLQGAVVFFSLVFAVLYPTVLHALNGQTIGKKLLSIKVVRSDGSRASLARIFWLRNIVNAIPGAIPLLGNLYVLADHLFIFGEKRQCLHDKIADTIVVRA